jgi:hypothetical protein
MLVWPLILTGENIQPYSLPHGVNNDLLSYLLNDEVFFLTQKTTNGTFSPWCFDPEGVSLKKLQPNKEYTILYDRLWEAFRIYPEEWIHILDITCLNGTFKDTFSRWLACEDFEDLDFNGFMKIFASEQESYGIDWIIRNIHQRLQELRSDLGNAELGIGLLLNYDYVVC